jgi:serine/threonine protein kinase
MAVKKLDKFNIIHHLGSGSFGDVYLCHDPFLKKDVAIKTIKVPDPENFVNAVKEGQILDLCRHKYTVEIKDIRSTIFEGEPVVIIIMEYLSKGSIQHYIENNFVSCKDANRVIQQILLGLENAHNNNVIHRDIKPGNIMFGDNGEAKLSDFGLAINYVMDESDIAGYRSHQPMEVIEGNPMDKLSDIYATGITYYRLLNNIRKILFSFKNRREWLDAVKKNLYPPRNYSPHIPDKLIKILNRAIHKNKNTRFKNCTEFRQALDKIKFNIDWRKVDHDKWIGADSNNNNYEIVKYKKKTGWVIDYKKNGIRKNDNCSINLSDNNVEAEFFDVIKKTTLF